MIDEDGFRHNVGIILINQDRRVLWARRAGQNAWQFPQGGIKEDETPEQALYRELDEEIGLSKDDVELIGVTHDWLRYRLPKRLIRYYSKPICVGQKQKWFILRLLADDSKISLNQSDVPEFDHWCWINYWHPLREVVSFKRRVYQQVLDEFATLIFPKSG